ncbi:HAD family hydrolase, partial [Sphingobium sp.]|uniref:HAD family hydrolase n=1 Tax=Sphingobium sp. TaxID=1912891 RepID=UPI0035C72B3B
MSRPLIITDCDEVLLHMVVHFKEWLETSQGVNFHLKGHNFAEALRWQTSGELLQPVDIWRMLGRFFDTEMDRQQPIKGAVEAINTLAEVADVVILTNLIDERRDKRAAQLAAIGIHAEVYTNQGPKGPALQKIIAEHAPS